MGSSVRSMSGSETQSPLLTDEISPSKQTNSSRLTNNNLQLVMTSSTLAETQAGSKYENDRFKKCSLSNMDPFSLASYKELLLRESNCQQ